MFVNTVTIVVLVFVVSFLGFYLYLRDKKSIDMQFKVDTDLPKPVAFKFTAEEKEEEVK